MHNLIPMGESHLVNTSDIQPSLLERFIGCLLGVAVGDALGAPLEYKKRGTFELVADMIGGGKFRLEPGTWTDDTSLTLCLADSLIEKGCFDAKDQMERYTKWYLEGHRSCTGVAIGVGATTQHALTRFAINPERPFVGLKGNHAQGNGSLMRLAAVPLFFQYDLDTTVYWSGESSRVTHGAPVCLDACRYVGALMNGILLGHNKELLCGSFTENLLETTLIGIDPIIRAVAAGSYKLKHETDISSSGYVVHSLEAALWAFWTTETFEAGLLRAVHLGDDADTLGAIFGQIAGAYYGRQAIPERWLLSLIKRQEIENTAERLFHRSVV